MKRHREASADPMRKEYDFSKLKEIKNPYLGQKKSPRHQSRPTAEIRGQRKFNCKRKSR